MPKTHALSLLFIFFHVPAWATNITSAQSGPWSLPSTWSPPQVPTAADTVTVLAPHTVTVDIATATASTTTINGTLTSSTVANSSLTLVGGNITVNAGGSLFMGTPASPMPLGVNAALILAYGAVGGQFGLIINDGGNFVVQGATKTPVLVATADALAGAASISVNSPASAGWQVGDSVTIGQTARSSTNQTESFAITSVGANSIGLSGSLSFSHKIAQAPIRVGNLSRNVLVRSSGTDTTNTSAYINTLTQYTTSFALAYGEFAYLGTNANNEHGLELGFQARGSISSCTVRNGYIGAYLNNPTNVLLAYNLLYNHQSIGAIANIGNGLLWRSNDSYSNSGSGLQISSNKATLDSNYAYSNKGGGIFAPGSNNTLISNVVYANTGDGVQIFNGSGNVSVSNQLYSNTIYGIEFNITASTNVSINDTIFNNGSRGISLNNSLNELVVGASLGYDPLGNPLADSSEVGFNSSTPETLILKGARINPTGGVSVTGFNIQGNYLFSLGQDLDVGSLRIWGDYGVSGSTLSLDYATQLYASTATAPKVMQGASISAVSVNSTNDSNALSQLVTVTYSATAGQWNIAGSSSGQLGTFPPGGGTANFPSASPQFNLTLTAAGAKDGDKADFALVAASNDANVLKKLLFGSAASSFNGGRSKLTIGPTGGLKLSGNASVPTLVSNIPGNSYYTLVDSGAFSMVYSTITNMDSGGLQLSGSAGVSLASSTFDSFGFTQTTSAYITATALTSSATFYNMEFDLSQSTAGHPYSYNVLVQQPDSGLSWVFASYSGPFSGAAYDYDPDSRVVWVDTLPHVTAMSPASGSVCVSTTSPVVLTFDKSMNPNSLGPAFSLTAIQDNLGNTINQLVPGVTSYASNQLTFVGALAGNTLYQVTLTTLAQDVSGNHLRRAYTAQFQTLMDRTMVNVFRDNVTGISVTLPAGALSANGSVQSSSILSLNLAAANSKLTGNSGDPHRYPIPGTLLDLKAYDPSCSNQQNNFVTNVTVSIPYPDADNDGIVDGTNPPVRASRLGVWWLDDANALWVRLPASSVDPVGKKVTASTPHFTTFALIGVADTDVSETFAFPVPFKPSLGHTAITFANLPQTANIKIFSVSGKLVNSLDTPDQSGKLIWDVKNSDGKDVASGVYVYLVTSGSNKMTGKLVIVR